MFKKEICFNKNASLTFDWFLLKGGLIKKRRFLINFDRVSDKILRGIECIDNKSF